MKNVLNSYLHQSLTNFFTLLLLGWEPPAKQQFTRKVIKGKVLAQTLVPFGLLLLNLNHTTVQYSIGFLPLSRDLWKRPDGPCQMAIGITVSCKLKHNELRNISVTKTAFWNQCTMQLTINWPTFLTDKSIFRQADVVNLKLLISSPR